MRSPLHRGLGSGSHPVPGGASDLWLSEHGKAYVFYFMGFHFVLSSELININ